jgi:metallophosphoesterase superfamily enzyme
MRREISGHYHPKASVKTRLRTVTGRCFVTDGQRLILPAFGAYAGGLNVRDPAIARLFAPEYSAYLLGDARLYAFPAWRLSGEYQAATLG